MEGRWKVYEGEKAPRCTCCGMWAPFARYTKKTGINGRELPNYCSCCGSKMKAIDECETCKYAKNNEWQENGICYACRGDTWVYGKKQNSRILKD